MEKKNSSKPKRSPALTLKDKSMLKHVLSPIEAAVMNGKSDPFFYKLEGMEIYLSRYTSSELLKTVKRKVELVVAAHRKDQLSINIPLKLRETFDDPKIILSLHPLLRNRLCKLECYSLFSIMQKGRNYFIEEQNFSKQNMKVLDSLFSKYKCGDLF